MKGEPRLARRDTLTGQRCRRPVFGIVEGEPRCNAPLTRVISYIPAPVQVVICPRCDVVEL